MSNMKLKANYKGKQCEVEVSEWGLRTMFIACTECYNELVQAYNNCEARELNAKIPEREVAQVVVQKLNDLRYTLDSLQTLYQLTKE